jgi:hypothetical protein
MVRSAESNGCKVDGEHPHARRWRDYYVDGVCRQTVLEVFVEDEFAGSFWRVWNLNELSLMLNLSCAISNRG